MFTKQQIEEIASKLKLMSKKDSSFGNINDIMDNDEFPILDNKVNRKTSFRSLVNYLNDKIGKPVKYYTVRVDVKDSDNNVINDAIVLINDKEGYAAPIQEGSLVSIVVKKEGYKTETRSILIEKDETVSVTLRKISNTCVVEVSYTPTDATIWLNGTKNINKTTVEKGSVVSVKVEKTGYNTYEQTYVITKDTFISVTLSKIEETQYTLTINTTPSDAKVTMTIDGKSEVKKYEKVNKGTRVDYRVEKEGYIPYESFIVVDSNITVDIRLSLVQSYTLKILPSPIDETDIKVTITDGTNSQETIINSSSEVNYAEYEFSSIKNTLTYTVEKEGYKSVSNTETFTGNTEKEIALSIETPVRPLCYLSFNIIPDNATLLIDDVVTDASSTISRYQGETVSIKCTRTGYKPYESTYTFTESNHTLNIVLSIQKTLRISSTNASFNALSIPSEGTSTSIIASLVNSVNSDNNNVTSQCEFTISNTDMVSLSDNGSSKTCTISANASSENRECTITAKYTENGEEYSATYRLVQLGQNITYFLDTDIDIITFDCNGETTNNRIIVSSNMEWTIS